MEADSIIGSSYDNSPQEMDSCIGGWKLELKRGEPQMKSPVGWGVWSVSGIAVNGREDDVKSVDAVEYIQIKEPRITLIESYYYYYLIISNIFIMDIILTEIWMECTLLQYQLLCYHIARFNTWTNK